MFTDQIPTGGITSNPWSNLDTSKTISEYLNGFDINIFINVMVFIFLIAFVVLIVKSIYKVKDINSTDDKKKVTIDMIIAEIGPQVFYGLIVIIIIGLIWAIFATPS